MTFRLEPFLLIGATTEEYDLPRPLRARFGIVERLECYELEDLGAMAMAAGNRLGFEVTADAEDIGLRLCRLPLEPGA